MAAVRRADSSWEGDLISGSGVVSVMAYFTQGGAAWTFVPLTKAPVAATTGITMAAASTPPTAAKATRRPSTLVRVKIVSPCCTRLRVRRNRQ